MRNMSLYAFVCAFATSVAAMPASAGHGATGFYKRNAQYFYLRANYPDQPWHGRHVVALPTSHQLGFENFTVHPETPPLKFVPFRLRNGNFALQGEGSNEDPIKATYLAALKSTTGTRTASMAVMYFSKPIKHSETIFDACPEGYECAVDQWMFDAAVDNVYPNFRFEGFNGSWIPFKDAGTEGWHVYWKGDAGPSHPIQIDMVPVNGS
ncbi:hypothetical protein HBI24_190120 [Parastagonospora nodorum]|nr:hypothetical protein HBH47_060870 [Parastagonospora nodorum]KAH5087689.1 hypothetical protein HBI73_144210 [Parastagonospora nodorum]KAH5219667.1 hypothetical protein HBI62_151340 [Parastagonospora nodorum]KAH5359648.1 hypothetical protein HBI49_136570 [Parastagonospora nodorum]KAH5575172.1 hypothetical protein HBI24_190120 [Parastagonospora nodorum]